VSVAFADLGSGEVLLLDADRVVHAASTMKVAVMLELFRRADAGELSLDAPVRVRNAFRSIADGSPYALSPADDDDPGLYAREGEEVPLRELVERMETRSSNLATNLLISLADPSRIERTLAGLGASGMRVLRGVEDGPAYRAGMNNTTTARALMAVLAALGRGTAASPAACAEMVAILARQEDREMVPAGLPPGMRVANKTGWITAVSHDAALVLPEGRAPYVLVVLTRGFPERAEALALGAEVSRRVWQAVAPQGR
jgi:beta-lactamase class A